MNEVRQMMLVDPSELLPEHRALLQMDFVRLGGGTTADRIQWIELVEGAIKARRAVLAGTSKGRPSQKDIFLGKHKTAAAGIEAEQQSNQSKTEKG